MRASFRAVIWAMMLRALDADDLVRELREVSGDLLKLSTAELRPWQGPVLIVVQYQARKNPWFESLLAAIEGQESPVHYVATWAKTFQLEQSTPDEPHQDDDSRHQEALRAAKEECPGVSVQNSSEPASPKFDQWILSQQGFDVEQVSSVCTEIGRMTGAIAAELSTPLDVLRISRVIVLLQQLVPETQRWLKGLPDSRRLEADLRTAKLAYEQGTALLGDRLSELLESGTYSAADLADALNVFKQKDSVLCLPGWLFNRAGQAVGNLTEPILFQCLLDARVRDLVKAALAAADECVDGNVTLLAAIPAPSADEVSDLDLSSVDRYLRKCLAELGSLLKELPTAIGARLLRLEQPSKIEVRLRQCVGLNRKLQPRVSEEVLASVLEYVASATDDSACIGEAELFERSVAFLEKTFGTAKDAPFSQVHGWVEKQRLQPENNVSSQAVS